MVRKFSGLFVIVLAAVLAFSFAPAKAAKIVPQMVQAEGDIGDLLIGGLYDVRTAPERAPSWQNFLVIQNTSNKYVAAHLRFRSHTKSIEVWDHIIILSPYDVFWCWLLRLPDGSVQIGSNDVHTLELSSLPVVGGVWTDTFKAQLLEDCGFPLPGGVSNVEEMQYGHFEVIGLWAKETITASNALAILHAAWGSDDGPRPAGFGEQGVLNYLGFEDCPNVLTGSMELGDTDYGQYYAYNLVAVKNFRTDTFGMTGGPYHRDRYPGGAIMYPPAVLQHYTTFSKGWCYGLNNSDKMYYINPDWATAMGPTLRDGDDFIAVVDQFANAPTNLYDDDGFVTVNPQLNQNSTVFAGGGFNAEWSLNDVEWALRKNQLWAFYYHDFFGADYWTDAVFTFPTKYLHYFFNGFPWWGFIDVQGGQVGYAGPGFNYNFQTCTNYWRKVDDYRSDLAAAWTRLDNGPIDVSGRVWDDEQHSDKEIGPSPDTPRFPWLPHETNVIRVGDPENILYVPEEYTAGQFTVYDWQLANGQRWGEVDPLFNMSGNLLRHNWSNLANQLPVVGGTIRIHNTGGAAVYRSTFLRWAFSEWAGVFGNGKQFPVNDTWPTK